jgi:HAD superfamily hydrolase (TIGR01459 family)
VVLPGLSALAGALDLLICDVWGVVHNGLVAHDSACAALGRFRAGGGTVIMVSNAPRPSPDVIRQFAQIGVPASAYDALITSGDVSRALIAAHSSARVLHLGPARDLPLFDGLAIVMTSAGVAGAAAADLCVCTGFADDERETPDDYAEVLATLARRGVPMICANPDLVVERGHRLIPCAGAMAEAYEALGGVATYAGKPHRPVYDQALALAARLRGAAVDPARLLAIGDAIRTDIKGAHGIGAPALMTLEGIHWQDVGAEEWPSRHAGWLAGQAAQPAYVMRKLAW